MKFFLNEKKMKRKTRVNGLKAFKNINTACIAFDSQAMCYQLFLNRCYRLPFSMEVNTKFWNILPYLLCPYIHSVNIKAC